MKVKKFAVPVVRIGYGHRIITVEAESKKRAEARALESAGDFEYSEGDVEYELSGGTTELGTPAQDKKKLGGWYSVDLPHIPVYPEYSCKEKK